MINIYSYLFKIFIFYFSSEISTCLLVVFEEFEERSSKILENYCRTRKKCIAMKLVKDDEDINHDLEPEGQISEPKFSLQTAWVWVRFSTHGHIVRIRCSNRSTTWLQLDVDDQMQSKFEEKMFESKIN